MNIFRVKWYTAQNIIEQENNKLQQLVFKCLITIISYNSIAIFAYDITYSRLCYST